MVRIYNHLEFSWLLQYMTVTEIEVSIRKPADCICTWTWQPVGTQGLIPEERDTLIMPHLFLSHMLSPPAKSCRYQCGTDGPIIHHRSETRRTLTYTCVLWLWLISIAVITQIRMGLYWDEEFVNETYSESISWQQFYFVVKTLQGLYNLSVCI
jgi:hypothetical protein